MESRRSRRIWRGHIREYGTARLLALPVNDTEQGYDYPARVRWSLAQDDVASYQEAAEFLNFHNIDMVACSTSMEFSAARPEATFCIYCAA